MFCCFWVQKCSEKSEKWNKIKLTSSSLKWSETNLASELSAAESPLSAAHLNIPSKRPLCWSSILEYWKYSTGKLTAMSVYGYSCRLFIRHVTPTHLLRTFYGVFQNLCDSFWSDLFIKNPRCFFQRFFDTSTVKKIVTIVVAIATLYHDIPVYTKNCLAN